MSQGRGGASSIDDAPPASWPGLQETGDPTVEGGSGAIEPRGSEGGDQGGDRAADDVTHIVRPEIDPGENDQQRRHRRSQRLAPVSEEQIGEDDGQGGRGVIGGKGPVLAGRDEEMRYPSLVGSRAVYE